MLRSVESVKYLDTIRSKLTVMQMGLSFYYDYIGS